MILIDCGDHLKVDSWTLHVEWPMLLTKLFSLDFRHICPWDIRTIYLVYVSGHLLYIWSCHDWVYDDFEWIGFIKFDFFAIILQYDGSYLDAILIYFSFGTFCFFGLGELQTLLIGDAGWNICYAMLGHIHIVLLYNDLFYFKLEFSFTWFGSCKFL